MFAQSVILLALLGLQTYASSPYTGTGVQGDGRICNGSLRIYAHSLHYDNNLTSCSKTPYDILQQNGDGSRVYRLRTHPRGCHVGVLVVRPEKDMPGGWEVIAFGNETAWRKNDAGDAIDCVMF